MQRLLELAIERHGGLILWQRLDSVLLEVKELSGPLPFAKGIGRTFARPHLIEVFPRARRVEFKDYPGPGSTGVFHHGAVGLVNLEDPERLQQDYRSSFAGLRKFRRWSPLDGIYFFGYALITYLSIPFILPQLPHTVHRHNDGFMVEATFPPEFDTHNVRQRFFFNRTGLLTRHDYTAEVVGPAAWGSHFSANYQQLESFMIARNRDVYFRLGRLVTPIPVLHARLEAIRITVV